MQGQSHFRVVLGPQHQNPGRSKHYIVTASGTQSFSQFKALEIVTCDEDAGFYLMHLTEQGNCADTFHLSLEDAFHQAEYEFDIQQDDWVKADSPY